MPTWLKVVLAILGGLCVLGASIGGIVAVVFWMTAGLVDTIDRQNAALRSGEDQAAYAETSQAFHQTTSLEAFQAFVNGNPLLRSVASHSFTNRSIENDTGSVSGSLTSDSGAVLPVHYSLVREQGVWRVLAIDLGAGTGKPL